MNVIDTTIVIWGNDNYNVLGLLRQLVPYVKRVILMVHKKKCKCATWSMYCSKYVVVHSCQEGINYLMSLGCNLENKGFVITTNDTLAEYVDQNYDALSQYYHLTGTQKQGLLTQMQDKEEMCRIALEIGMNVPKSFALKQDTNIKEFCFPCVIKPIKQTATVHERFKYIVVNNDKEAESFIHELKDDDNYLVQQYVKREEEYLMYGCRLNNGEVVVPGAIIKDRWHHGKVVKDIPATVSVELMKKFLERIDYYGLFSIEFGLMDGKAYFFEVNLRNDGTSLYYYLSGANMPLLWVASFFNRQYEVPKQVTKDNFFIDGLGDLPCVFMGDISFRQWRRDVKTADLYRHYDSKDWKPFIGTAMSMLPLQLALFLLGRYKNVKRK